MRLRGKSPEVLSKKDPISPECLAACLYFMCLPFTVVTTPFGSLLKVVPLPIMAFLVLRILMGKSELTFHYVHFCYLIYIIYTISMLFVFHDSKAVTTTKDMVLGTLMFLLITARIYTNREREWIESAWLIVGLICIYACLSSTEVVSKSESRAVVRILGFEEDQNQFCAYLIMPTLISVKRFLERRRGYPVYLVIIALSFYSILKTGSRGGLLGILLGLFAYAAIGIKSVKTRLILFASAAALTLMIVTVVVPLLPEDVAARYTIQAVEEDGGSGRTEIWRFLIDYSFREPGRLLRGSGIFSTYGIMKSAGFQNGVAHNAFIQILNDEGMIGLLLFIISIVSCLTRNMKREPLYACAYLSMLGFAISLTFYVFKPNLNIMMMCAMSFYGSLPQDRLHDTTKGASLYA